MLSSPSLARLSMPAMPLFTHTAVPSLVSLLNSSNRPALTPLWTPTTDATLPEDSTICLVRDDAPHQGASDDDSPCLDSAASPCETPTGGAIHLVPKRPPPIGSLAQPVIHIQSPALRKTYIQAGASAPPERALGVNLAWLGLQLKPLGERPFAIEIGVVDSDGHPGRIRISSFQVRCAT